MYVLVTGGAGYIGSHTVLELLDAGYSVMAIDNFSNSIPDEFGNSLALNRVSEMTRKEIRFKKADIVNLDEIEPIFASEKFDAVVHIAAFKAVGESSLQPIKYYINNVIGSINVISLCRKYNVKTFVFSSSTAVYGLPTELPLTETASTGVRTTNPYGRTKHMIEQVLKDLSAAESGWNIIFLRYFNVVGAHPSGKIGEDPQGIPNNLMPFVSQVAVGRLPILEVFGDKYETPDGTGVRDYIHVVDLAKGHVAALNRIQKLRNIGLEIYNLGTGRGYSVLEMVAAFEKIAGKQ
uniref:UDP-glucose 4-epimerase n=1 Tax=Panagrolaimus sp. JU765 TaxID=591449 RepID=A0AC34R3J9_9BILA